MDLSELDFDSVGDILSSLSEEDVENLTKMASQMFASSKDNKEETKQENKSSFGFDGIPFDADSIARIFSIMNKLKNQPEDNRIKLLNTLRPMLSEPRRHKVDEAVQMLRIMTVLPSFFN